MSLTRRIKLIWDFRGDQAGEVARHHQRHLREYIAVTGLKLDITGHKDLSSMHSTAFMVVEEDELPNVRDTLMPHRGEVYSE